MIDRRDFLRRGLVTAAGLLLPWTPERVYSFAAPRQKREELLWPERFSERHIGYIVGDIDEAAFPPFSASFEAVGELDRFYRGASIPDLINDAVLEHPGGI